MSPWPHQSLITKSGVHPGVTMTPAGVMMKAPTNDRTNSPDRVKVSTQFLRCLGQPITALSLLQGAAHLTTQTPVRRPEFGFFYFYFYFLFFCFLPMPALSDRAQGNLTRILSHPESRRVGIHVASGNQRTRVGVRIHTILVLRVVVRGPRYAYKQYAHCFPGVYPDREESQG